MNIKYEFRKDKKVYTDVHIPDNSGKKLITIDALIDTGATNSIVSEDAIDDIMCSVIKFEDMNNRKDIEQFDYLIKCKRFNLAQSLIGKLNHLIIGVGNGYYKCDKVTIPSLKIFNHEFINVELTKCDRINIIGMDILSQFRLIIDYNDRYFDAILKGTMEKSNMFSAVYNN